MIQDEKLGLKFKDLRFAKLFNVFCGSFAPANILERDPLLGKLSKATQTNPEKLSNAVVEEALRSKYTIMYKYSITIKSQSSFKVTFNGENNNRSDTWTVAHST